MIDDALESCFKSLMSKLYHLAFQEDYADGDITSEAIFLKCNQQAKAHFLAKEDLVVSGWPVVKKFAKSLFPSLKIRVLVKDKTFVKKKQILGTVSGPVLQLLAFERTALNFFQHLCGVATLTHQFVKTVESYNVKILDTRKTLPGYRELEKKAVRDGGGFNHRFSLGDQYLIKDNHIDAAGGVALALQKVIAHRRKQRKKCKIEIEVRTLAELYEALSWKPHIVMLDNMKTNQIKKAKTLRDQLSQKTKLEVSGGVTLKTVARFARCGIDRISVGALTHSAKASDISLKIR